MSERPEARWIDATAAAELVGVTRRQLMRLVNHHKVPIIRVNARDARFDSVAIAKAVNMRPRSDLALCSLRMLRGQAIHRRRTYRMVARHMAWRQKY